MELKPQDTLLAIKYWSINRNGLVSSVRGISEAIGISVGEVSKARKRLVASHLVAGRPEGVFVEKGALLEWLCYGVRYAYPQQTFGYGRGMATSWNCPFVKSELVAPVPSLVWSVPDGETEGVLLKPIHASVPFAANRDKRLYCALALLEAIRGGKPRELSIARDLMVNLIKDKS